MAWDDKFYAVSIPKRVMYNCNITQFEMYNVVIAFKHWAPRWKNSLVEVGCDNAAVVQGPVSRRLLKIKATLNSRISLTFSLL